MYLFIHSENLYSALSRHFRYLRGYYFPKRIVPKRMYRAMHGAKWARGIRSSPSVAERSKDVLQQWDAEVTQARWSTAKNATWNQSSDALGVLYPLGYRTPMQHITYACMQCILGMQAIAGTQGDLEGPSTIRLERSDRKDLSHSRGWNSKPREVGRHYEDGVVDWIKGRALHPVKQEG